MTIPLAALEFRERERFIAGPGQGFERGVDNNKNDQIHDQVHDNKHKLWL